MEIVLNKNVFVDFRIHWNTLIKILYLKGYRWLFSQNQRVRIGLLDYRRYDALAKHVKPFLKKTLKWKDVSAPTTPSEDITTIIKSLNPNKATGRDLIPLKTIKASANIIARHLTGMMNKDLKANKYSESAKAAIVQFGRV